MNPEPKNQVTFEKSESDPDYTLAAIFLFGFAFLIFSAIAKLVC